MHILVAALHRPSKPTGVCRYAANVARCLAETKEVNKVTLAVGEWQRDYFSSALALESPKIFLKSINISNNSLSRNLWFLFGLPKLAKQLSPDVVHLSFPLPFVKSFFSSPVISTIHDLYPYEYPENFGSWQAHFNRLFLNQCLHQSDALTCVSKNTLQSLRYYFPHISSSKKVAVIYNSIDFRDVIPVPPKGLDDVSSASFLLTVGQHRKNKNLDLLIQAFALLLQAKKLSESSKLVIVGSSGPETDNLSNLINTFSLERQVLMLSGLQDGELSWLYQNCRLFIIASSTEGFCIPLAEALSFSCTVVCSAIPVFKEVGSDQCTYFDLQGDTIKNLSQAINQALDEPPKKINCKDTRFSMANVAQEYLGLYQKVRVSQSISSFAIKKS
jgi:glycosyltransferase involved in cell wall biosynthesis